MSKMICSLRLSEHWVIGATQFQEPPHTYERKETGHYDGKYTLHHIEWNAHANRHEAVYYHEKAAML